MKPMRLHPLPLPFCLLAATVLGMGLSIQSIQAQVQSKNCALLASMKPAGSRAFNDIWGYHDPVTQREAAILGGSNATYIIETTNPRKPVLRGSFSQSSSGWRNSIWGDMKAWKGFAYVVTEGGGGMKVIDLRNMSKPKLMQTWGKTLWSHAHNIALDRQRGILIVHGTGRRSDVVRFIDVDTTPGTPKLAGSWRGPYQHDLSMQHGLLHGAEIYLGRYALYDVSKSFSSPRLLGWVRTPRAFTHNTWPTYDDQYCVTTDERSNGPMAIYDISARRTPVFVAKYHAGPTSSIIHNAYVKDYVAHMSHYTEGYRSVDISNPSKPVEVAYYDDHAGSSSGYGGHWGCYCFMPSGVVFASRETNGLLILKPKSSSIRYGKASAGSAGIAPYAFTIGSAYLGNASFKLGCRMAKASSLVVSALSGTRASVQVRGLHFNVGLANALILTSTSDSKGESLIPVPVPNNASLQGIKLDTQHFVLDSAGPLGFSATQGLEFETFTK